MKQALKSKILAKRNSFNKNGIIEKSKKIKEILYALPEFKKAKNIMLYVSFNNEVITQNIIKGLLIKKEKAVVVPYVVKNSPILQLSELKNFNDLEQKTFGILEPKREFIRKFDIKNLDLVIVPGIVFDRKCHRIGYGHGYYDRFLEKLRKNTTKIGLCYEFQLVNKIVEGKYDAPMNIVITENRLIRNPA